MAFKGFGTPASTSGSGTSGFTFGQTQSTAAPTFGQPASTATTGFGFGSSTAAAPGGGFSFGGTGTTTASSTGFSFPAKTTTASTATPVLGFGSMTSASSGFGSTTSTLGFGSTTTSTGFGTATSSQGFGLSTQQSSTKPAFKGLGGVDPSVSTSNNNGNGNRNDTISQAVKEQNIPDEICKDVKAFEEYVAKQKAESNEVGKFSVHSLHKINEEIGSLSTALSVISTAVQRNKSAVEKLRSDFGGQLCHAEMSQRTQDIPPTLQHENIAPLRYFVDLVMEFGESMQIYKQQIEELENHLHFLSHPSSLSPHDISVALCKMQESFISLAANLHSIHESVKHIKEQYLYYRHMVLGDSTDIFAANKKTKQESRPAAKSPRSQGPSPLSNMSNVAAIAMATMLQQPQQTQQNPPSQSLVKPSFGAATGGLFGSNTASAGTTGSSSSSGGLFGASKTGFGSSNSLRPALSAGFNPASSGGNAFFGNTTFNSSAGVTFGGAALKPFDLKPPPAAAGKRNRK